MGNLFFIVNVGHLGLSFRSKRKLVSTGLLLLPRVIPNNNVNILFKIKKNIGPVICLSTMTRDM